MGPIPVGLVIFFIVALVVIAAGLALFLPLREQPGLEPKKLPLITQPYLAGEPVEQPTPYFAAPIPESPDPLDVAANLDKKALLAMAMVFGVFAVMGGYFFFSPTLRATAAVMQLEESAHRGAELYASVCFDCHGERGQGLVGLPLNRADYRATCDPNGQPAEGAEACKPGDDQKVSDFLFKTIARGREFPPPRYSMPAWSRDEGGPLNTEQIRQLVRLIMHGDWELPLQLREELVQEEIEVMKDEDMRRAAEQLGIEGAAGMDRETLQARVLEERLKPQPPPAPKPESPEALGRSVAQSSCVSCHSFTPGQPSNLAQAPNLGRYGAEGPFNDRVKALRDSGDAQWLRKWVANAPSIKPDTPMPRWEGVLPPESIDAVVAYLQSLR
jgi:mono/diheme cytochrome c family protein